MGRIYSVDLQFEPENHAGVKAPTDISRICHDMGMISFPFPVQKYMFPQGLDKLRSRIWLLRGAPVYSADQKRKGVPLHRADS